jgi:2-dehydropantoate 2-reductase
MRGLGLRPVDLPGVPVSLLARAIFLPPPLTQPLLYRAVVGGRGQKMPSFYSDLERGKSEVAWLNGAIAGEGQRLGIPTPANRRLAEVLAGLAEGRLRREAFRGRPEALLLDGLPAS